MASKGKRSKQSPSEKLRAGKLAAQKEVERLVQAAKPKEHTVSPKQRPRKAKSRAQQPGAVLAPGPSKYVSTKNSVSKSYMQPKSPETRTCSPDPLTAADVDMFLLNDRRHLSGGLTRVPTVRLPQTKALVEQHKSRQPFRFLDLPCEIRIIVYDYVIPKERYSILRGEGKGRCMALTHRTRLRAVGSQLSPTTLARRQECRRLPHTRRPSHYEELSRHASAVSLFWTCKSVYEGASEVFYRKSTFHFTRLNTLRCFLDNVTPANKRNIKSLQLRHDEYGHPARTDHAWCKTLADQSWQFLCYRIYAECPTLRSLSLDLHTRFCPITFGPLDRRMIDHDDFTRQWMLALLPFARLTQLQSVRCRVWNGRVESTVLEVECYKLRQQILGNRWRDEDQVGKNGFGYGISSGAVAG